MCLQDKKSQRGGGRWINWGRGWEGFNHCHPVTEGRWKVIKGAAHRHRHQPCTKCFASIIPPHVASLLPLHISSGPSQSTSSSPSALAQAAGHHLLLVTLSVPTCSPLGLCKSKLLLLLLCHSWWQSYAPPLAFFSANLFDPPGTTLSLSSFHWVCAPRLILNKLM